jgi:hypothetical protein
MAAGTREVVTPHLQSYAGLDVKTIERVRDLTAAVFVLFAALAAIAREADAPRWLLLTLAAVALVGALVALVLIWVKQLLESEQEAAERFKSAAKLLGEKDATVAAIYLLEGVARDAPEHYHGPIVELLSAYVREHAPWPPRHSAQTRPPADVQAALTVLGRRTPRDGEPEIRLSGTDLRGAVLRSGHFERARFRRTHLEGARLEGSHLEGAKFRDAHLEGTDFQPDRDLRLPAASLEGAEFPGASYDADTRWPEGFDPVDRCRRDESA